MKLIFYVVLGFCSISQSVHADSYFDYRNGRRYFCTLDDQQEPVTCVKRCRSRMSDGSCINYGSDYCGPNASCTPNCTSRLSNGDCNVYGEDICS